MLTDATLVLIFSFLANPLVSWVKACRWSSWLKQLTLLGVSLVFALLQTSIDAASSGTFSWGMLLGTTPAIFTLATLIYSGHFKNTKLNQDLEATGPLGDGGRSDPT